MKKVLSLCLAAFLFLPLGAAADTVQNARVLYDLGLLKGTGSEFSEAGLELSRNATRTEICITVVRMLGMEEKAAYQQNGHPFGDVPAWGSAAVGWLYENYLVNGVGETYFGAQDIATVQQFATMLLRVLGYSDAAGDFTYDSAVRTAIEKGLLGAGAEMRYELSRSEMIDMCYKALRTPIKNSKRLLIRKLCDGRAVDELRAKTLGVLTPPTISDSFASVPETLGKITVRRDGPVYRLELGKPVEHYGLRVFVQAEAGGGIMEVKTSGTPYLQKGEISYLGGGSAGYIRTFTIHGLELDGKYEFIVIKTSSEGELYLTTAKSQAVWG